MANKLHDVYDIAIIGGGASGIMLAANLKISPRRGIILEGSPKLGSKLLMSGGGRCNITHGGSIKDFLNAYGSAGTYLRRCLYKHSNIELVKRFNSMGVALADENGNAINMSDSTALNNISRIFPSSMKSKDVVDALISEAVHNMWQIETGAKVCAICENTSNEIAEKLWNISIVGRGHIAARSVVVATGGITYPETGSDGSVLKILSKLGIDIIKPKSALAPIYVNDYPYADLSGISIPNVEVSILHSDETRALKNKYARLSGDILFTYEGFSGPVILNISKYAEPGDIISIKYAKNLSELPKRMQRIVEERAKGPSGDIRTKALDSLMNQDEFIISKIEPRGMVTSGGVSLSEVDFTSMRIKGSYPNLSSDLNEPLANLNNLSPALKEKDSDAFTSESLFVIGEAIDADGITGGYNLQLCWSTANTAADYIRSIL